MFHRTKLDVPPLSHRLCTDFGTEVQRRIIGRSREEYIGRNGGKKTSKKTPHWSHDWWGVEKNMFN